MSSFEEKWNEVCNFLNEHYENPDLSGLRLVLCIYISHFYYDDPANLVFVAGAPGSGKTEIAIGALEVLKSTYPIDELSTSAFLSGFGERTGYLDKLKGGNGIFTFADFTTSLLSKDPLTRADIVGQIRRIADGKFTKKVGNRAKLLEWKGKASFVAACTPDIEDYWALNRDLGERWLTLKWKSPTRHDYESLMKYAEKAAKHQGKTVWIKNKYARLIKELMQEIGPGVEVESSSMFSALALVLEILRTNVKREYIGGKYKIVGTGNQQMLTRVAKSLSSICRASTALRNSDTLEQVDIDLARRLALDSIPTRRWDLINPMIENYPTPLLRFELLALSGLPRTSFDRILEDLEHLGILCISEKSDDGANFVQANENALDRWKGAKITFKLQFLKLLTQAQIIGNKSAQRG